MKQILAAILLTFALQTAWAMDIGTAKNLHLVGEGKFGYVLPLKKPPSSEVSELIARVNAKRKATFARTASKTGTTVEQVAHRFYELAVQRTAPGNSYQDPSGRWMKK